MPAPIPRRPEDLTPSWIGEILGARGLLGVQRPVGVRQTLIGIERGFLSQTIRIEVDYDPGDGAAPRSAVAKIEPARGTFLEAERGVKAFEREIRFYREIAPSLPIRVPLIYHADDSEDGKVLLMEDLSHLTSADQLHGLRNEQVIRTVREAAKLHAAAWGCEGPVYGWVPLHDHFFADGYAEHWPAFAAAYELRIGREALRLGERVASNLDAIEAQIASRPTTLIHGDLRADNLLFGDDEVVLLDWQLANRSLGAIDIARLMGGSEPAAERRGHQLEVFAAWHESLLRAGVGGYEMEEALADLRLAVLYCLVIPLKGFALAGRDPGPRTARLLDAQAERFFASALELDAAAALP